MLKVNSACWIKSSFIFINIFLSDLLFAYKRQRNKSLNDFLEWRSQNIEKQKGSPWQSRRGASTAGGLIPGPGTKILHSLWHSQEKRTNNNKTQIAFILNSMGMKRK